MKTIYQKTTLVLSAASLLCFSPALAAADEDIAFFEKTYGKKIEGVKPMEEYSDPDQFYSAIASQLGVSQSAGEAVMKKFGWKPDGNHIQKTITKRGKGTWQVMVFQFGIDPKTGKPDVGTMESVMVEMDDAGKMIFQDVPGGGASKPVALKAARKALKAHLESLLKGEIETLEKSYAENVVLVAGSEYLKPEYGLLGDGGRSKNLTVDRASLIGVIKEHRNFFSGEVVEKLLGKFIYTTMISKAGEYATLPADPVKTEDGKVRFNLKDGDVVIKAGPEKGDFVLFQLRPVGERWEVVAEYSD